MKNSKIKKIEAREILDSRGEPTVEVKLFTDFGVFRDSVPSGASKGKTEAKELRDGGKRFFGKGVSGAVKNVKEIIAKKLKGEDVLEQKRIDNILLELDGPKDKSHLGANSILPVSMAVCRAGAFASSLPLYSYINSLFLKSRKLKIPFPSFNIINGGAHAGNDLDIQEFMIMPQEKKFSKNLQIGVEVYHSLKEILGMNFGKSAINLGDEGGFAPPLSRTKQALELLKKSIKEAGYLDKVKIGLDCAATHFFKGLEYNLDNSSLTQKGLLSFYEKLVRDFPIIFLEDPFSQDDWQGFQEITRKLKRRIIILGDDLTTTNVERIKKAKKENACTGIIVKPNQIGTITETLEAVKLAKSFRWKIMVSHRSGDTIDDFIADLSVGIVADFIKSGAPARGERVAKYNRLLEIEQEIKKL